MSEDGVNSMGLREQKERKWEQVQIKAFRLWVNTYLEPLGYRIEDVSEDFKSGVNLCFFLEEVGKKKLQRWSKKPAMRVHKIENLNIALNFIQKDLGVRLVGIGAEDIADGQLKLTLGMLWSMYKRLRIEAISEEGQSSEMGLLAWLKKMTDDYEGVDIKNFKESFNDGLAFCALINAMDPEALNFDELDQADNEKNIALAFETAEQKLGIPKLLDAEDLLSGNTDERAVILYSSMFFHAYVADEEKRKLRTEKKSIKQQIADLEAALARERAEKERLLQAKQQQTVQNQRDFSDKDALIARLRARIKELMEEIAFLQKRVLSDSELRAVLEAKLKMLQELLDGVNEAEAARDAEAAGKRDLAGAAASRGLKSGPKKLSKEELLDWVRKTTEGYNGVNIEDFHSSFADGLAFAALVHRLEPSAIDFDSLSAGNAEENLKKALDAAQQKLGIPASISISDLLNKTATDNEVADYTSQFYEKYVTESPLFGNPTVGKDGATPNRLAGQFPPKLGLSGAKFTPEDLLEWVKNTTKDYPNVDVQNWTSSFNDGMALAALVHSMDPSAIDFDGLDPANGKDNAIRALNAAQKRLGIPKSFEAEDLVNGKVSEGDMIAYNAQFFEKFLENSGLFDKAKSQGVHGRISPETDLLDWAKAVTRDYDNVDVTNFTDSFNDGLAFSAIVNSIKPDALDFAALDPKNSKENVENVLRVAAEALGVPPILKAEELLNGTADERDIIAYNAKLFNKYLEEVVLDDSSKYAPADLLKWAQKMTEGYDNVDVKDFKDSFNDGMAFSALLHAMDPSCIDFNNIDPSQSKKNLANAVSIAENRFGIPRGAGAENILEGEADEADVIAYTSQFLDAYIDEAGRYAIAGAKTRSVDTYAPENDLLQWAKKLTEDYDNVDVSSFKHSFNDGLAFAAIVNAIKPDAIDFASLSPDAAEENLKAAFDAASESLGVPKLLSVDDMLEGKADERDIANYTSKLFQKYLDEIDTQKAPFTEADLLAWAKRTTADYDNVQIENFDGSFKDGLALAALVHAMDPSAIDFESLTSQDGQANVTRALNAAEKRFGIPQDKINAAAVANGSAAKEVAAYTGELFKKYLEEVGKFGKYASSAENAMDRAVSAQLTDEDDRDALLDELEERKQRLLDELAALQRDLEKEVATRRKMADEIRFLKDQALADANLRDVLEAKAALLQNLLDGTNQTVDQLTKEQDRMMRDLEAEKKRREEMGAGLNNLEAERGNLLTDSEEKDRRLAELEERRQKLLAELAELQKRIQAEMARRQEQAAEIASLKQKVESMSSKQIVQSKARVGLDALKKNLEDHLEDMYRWRELHDVEGGSIEDFDLTKVIADLSGKPFEEQIENLDSRLQEENRNLSRIIKLQDDKNYLNDVVIKAGWLVMKGHKEWKKRWFVLTGDRLNFFEEEESPDIAGSIQLDQGCDVVRHKAIKEEEGSNKKVWPLKVTVGDRKLFIRAASKKERHSWFAAISSKIAHLNYMNHCETTGERPDSRLIGALSASSVPHIDLSFRPISNAAVDALVRGIPGRDELESISIESASMNSTQFARLCEVLEKLSGVKQFNFAKNDFDSTAGTKLARAIGAETTDINMANNGRLGDDFVSALAPAIAKCKTLHSLNLCGTGVSAAGVATLVETLVQGDVVLQDLAMNDNKLGDEGITALLPLFEKVAFKRVLLSNNKIGDAGVKALATALTSSTVEELDLSNNSITAEGAIALKTLMESNDHLHTLTLSGNTQMATGAADAQALLTPAGLKITSLVYSRN